VTRIIAGTAGGRTLRTPPGSGTRPTSDRVREAVFSALDARDAVRGRRVLDLYAGSGALGLEAASRGASSVVLVESDPRAAAVITRNAADLALRGVRVDRSTVLRALGAQPRPEDAADLVLVDPPYGSGEPELTAVLARLAAGWMAEDGILVVERSTRSPEPAWPPGIRRSGKPRRYGETTVWLAERHDARARTGTPRALPGARLDQTLPLDQAVPLDQTVPMTDTRIPRPTAGDVVERILEDHRLFEDLLRECRRTDRDRAAARTALAEVLVAHAVAEEETVYPELRRSRAISGHEEEHSEEEHAEIIEALLSFLQARGTDTQKYDDTLEELATTVNHHSAEEETTILNPARDEVSEQRRAELGVAWLARRNELLDAGCASEEQVRAILAEAEEEGVLAPEGARMEADAVQEDAKKTAEEIEEKAKQETTG
jgi:16S rRNA (guanine(966)-N(2))-methyltransferase RsmD